MKDRKGAVPVIATMLLLVIVSATALVLYSYVSGATILPDTDQHTEKMLEKLKAVEVKGSPNGDFNVTFMNVGSEDAVIDMFYVKDFYGNTVAAIPVAVEIGVGETQNFLFDSWVIGSGPWSWYEIYGVTQRGNTVRANLFSFLSGAYELGDRPEGETDNMFNVANVTVNGTDITTGELLTNLTYLDGNTFDNSTGNINLNYSASPISAYEFDFDTNAYSIKNNETDRLEEAERNPSSANVIHMNIHGAAGDMIGVEFSGRTLNSKYPYLKLSFGFELNNQPAFLGMNGTAQFYDWALGQYVTSGNGYWEFNSSSIFWDPYGQGGNYHNYTVIPLISRGNLLGPNGEWSLRINVTSTAANWNMDWNFLFVEEIAGNTNGTEIIFLFKLANITETDVTRLLFTATGMFPNSSYSYLVGFFNDDLHAWNYFGAIQGSPGSQTGVFEVATNCSTYISPANITLVRIATENNLPTVEQIQIDQTRLIVRVQ